MAFSSQFHSRRAAPVAGPSARRCVAQPLIRAARLRAAAQQWPEPQFCARVLSTVGKEGGCVDVEEARVLYENGWTFLDVRSEHEASENGRIRHTTSIPLYHVHRKYNPQLQQRVQVEEPNTEFLATVERRFPDKDGSRLLVFCGEGLEVSVEALEALEDAGYVRLAGLKGGFAAWTEVFDSMLARRKAFPSSSAGPSSRPQRQSFFPSGFGAAAAAAATTAQLSHA